MLASVFARHGVYTSRSAFLDGFTTAIWVAVGFSGLGVVSALFTARQPRIAHAPEIAVGARPMLVGEHA